MRLGLVLTSAWLLALGAFMVRASVRDATAGDPGAPAARWPGDGLVARDPAGPTLIVTVHPRCPCTPASVEALRQLLARVATPLRATLLVVRPTGAPADFEATPSVAAARALPGARVVIDVDGVEAARLGARTSGHVLLIDAGGRLAFSGGITPARGHHGPSAGATSLEALLREQGAPRGAAPVFGCPLGGVR